MRIAVIGAGIGGLVVAAGLQRDGHDVVVYEQREEPTPAGAGLTLFGNAMDALDMIDLGETVRSVSSNAIATMRSGQREPSGAWLVTAPTTATASMRSVHRVALHKALTDSLTPGSLKAGTPAVVASDGRPTVTIGNTAETFDVVVAADGIRSKNRQILGLDTGLRYSGYTAWRGVTTNHVDLQSNAGETWGRGQLFGMVPLPDDRIYWFATLNTPANTAFPDEHLEVRNRFAGWHTPIEECIAATPASTLMRHDIYDLARPLKSFVRGRTVLLGDAAHAMTPNLGQGAGQGIEDAATLTLLLRHAEEANLDAQLARYSGLRTKRTTAIWQRSRMAGRVAQASHPVAATLRNAALRLTPASAMGAVSQQLLSWPKPVA